MNDLNKLREDYNSLREQLDKQQNVLKAYLQDNLPRGKGKCTRQDVPSVTHRDVLAENSRWTSTPLRGCIDDWPSYNDLDQRGSTRKLARDDKQPPHFGVNHLGTKAVSHTRGKRKAVSEIPRHTGRGPSLIHHGFESKRVRSSASRHLRSRLSKAGANPQYAVRHTKQQAVAGTEMKKVHSKAPLCDLRETSVSKRATPTTLFDGGGGNADGNDDDGTYLENLLSEGNNRFAATTRARDVTPRPKSILLTPGGHTKKTPMRVSFLERLNRNHYGSPIWQPLDRDDDRVEAPAPSSRDSLHERSFGSVTQPLLGYDWIAGLMDSDSSLDDKSAAYLDAVKQFRQLNREDCVHSSVITDQGEISMSQSIQEVDDGNTKSQHKCIHNYVLNERLFAVPLHGDQNGESLCAVCQTRRSRPLKRESPSYIRVSIPRSTLMSPYRLNPHRRQSFDPTDSMGLSQHCLAGWQNSRPAMMPAASTVDLKASVDRTMLAASSLFDPTLNDVHHASLGRPLGPSRHTQELLNQSHALRVDLQRLERAGLSLAPSPGLSQSSALL